MQPTARHVNVQSLYPFCGRYMSIPISLLPTPAKYRQIPPGQCRCMPTTTPDPCHITTSLCLFEQRRSTSTDRLTACMSCTVPNASHRAHRFSSFNVLRCRCRFAATPKAHTAGCRKSEQNAVLWSEIIVPGVLQSNDSPHGNAQAPNSLHFVASGLVGPNPVTVVHSACTLIPAGFQFGTELLS